VVAAPGSHARGGRGAARGLGLRKKISGKKEKGKEKGEKGKENEEKKTENRKKRKIREEK
jgi:hypothetical protein